MRGAWPAPASVRSRGSGWGGGVVAAVGTRAPVALPPVGLGRGFSGRRERRSRLRGAWPAPASVGLCCGAAPPLGCGGRGASPSGWRRRGAGRRVVPFASGGQGGQRRQRGAARTQSTKRRRIGVSARTEARVAGHLDSTGCRSGQTPSKKGTVKPAPGPSCVDRAGCSTKSTERRRIGVSTRREARVAGHLDSTGFRQRQRFR